MRNAECVRCIGVLESCSGLPPLVYAGVTRLACVSVLCACRVHKTSSAHRLFTCLLVQCRPTAKVCLVLSLCWGTVTLMCAGMVTWAAMHRNLRAFITGRTNVPCVHVCACAWGGDAVSPQ